MSDKKKVLETVRAAGQVKEKYLNNSTNLVHWKY
jgi:hypothetical protein